MPARHPSDRSRPNVRPGEPRWRHSGEHGLPHHSTVTQAAWCACAYSCAESPSRRWRRVPLPEEPSASPWQLRTTTSSRSCAQGNGEPRARPSTAAPRRGRAERRRPAAEPDSELHRAGSRRDDRQSGGHRRTSAMTRLAAECPHLGDRGDREPVDPGAGCRVRRLQRSGVGHAGDQGGCRLLGRKPVGIVIMMGELNKNAVW